MVRDNSPISPELQQAQEELLEKRQAARAARLSAGLPVDIVQNLPACTSSGDGRRFLDPRRPCPTVEKPGETAVSWEMRNCLGHVAQLQLLNGLGLPRTAVSFPSVPLPEVSQQPNDSQTASEADATTVRRFLSEESIRCYPDVALASKEADKGMAFQTWLVISHLDEGQGDIDQEWFLELTSKQGSVYRWSGPDVSNENSRRQARRRVNECIDAGFLRLGDDGRLYRTGIAKIKGMLGIGRVDCQPVDLSIDIATAGAGKFNAAIYAAWLGGRNNPDNPISREAIENETAIPARSQRRYDRVARVKKTINLSTNGRANDVNRQNGAWENGNASFVFVDVQGRQGPKNGRYIARQLPNTYQTKHEQSSRNRNAKRRLNRQLDNPGDNGRWAMSDYEPVDPLYHDTPAAAAGAFNRQPETAVYFRSNVASSTASLWHQIGGG